MRKIESAKKLSYVHSDIRGSLFMEAMRMEEQGIDVLKLNTGNPAAFGFELPESVRAALDGQEALGLGYCDFKGMPQAREAIYDYEAGKGISGFTSDDVFIGNGVSEVASFALTPLLNDGDEVLVPAPGYSLWSNSVYLAGGRPVFYICDEKADWYPDIQDIRSKISPRTKALILINPNNPTGVFYPKEILIRIAEIAEEHNLLIFSDEIYDRLVMDGLKHTSIASLAPDLPVVTMNGLSKSHCLCGYRCGWMVISGPHNLTEEYKQGIRQLTSMRLCANTLAQLVIPAALKDTETPNSMVMPGGRLYEQREAAVAELKKIDGISFVKNNSAFYLFPKLDIQRFNITDDRKFAKDLLHAANILLVPGSGFDWQMPDHFRIVMLPEKEVLRNAVKRLGVFLDHYHQT
ncbi:aminotransferase class I/II-fold pyridoxal phosphate-dependent enzyme [Lachnotalea sp. AF33-28]|uniref:aminotransferase class I/II-fold pyridoxal phosphate-dependent enzyme n=1 Tax=Lachnotalea sp. AF33-28 TaxID=2292046 RepID=UPI000E49B3BB|nr:aminotransferase class I/II-fold pyridoxal phosphate-dependent enzyme [Lachnotalea sp. AF33-28]RHP30294.1 aminotransferase class I/II-fold pyridoxal phosphate-dependent enzyme [Lachnotalea sp. AF33-28]